MIRALFFFAVATIAHAGNETIGLGVCSYSATCSVSGITGVCVSISAGCCSGTTTSGLCPGSSDILCCTNNPCQTPQGKHFFDKVFNVCIYILHLLDLYIPKAMDNVSKLVLALEQK